MPITAFEALKPLLAKYDRPGPRYTSYPTAPEFHDGVQSRKYVLGLGEIAASEALSIYIHIPFCERRCTYCGCHVIPTPQHAIAATYLRYLLKEIRAVRRELRSPARVRTVHLGGGTPTYLSPTQLEELFQSIRSHFLLEEGAEISVEVDPRVTTEAHLKALRGAGVTRLSLGVQDTSAEVQAAIGRFQDWEATVRFYGLCRDLGFGSLSIDLVYGLPCQTTERFERTVGDVIALKPDRVAAFGYAHVPWKLSNQRAIAEETLPAAHDRLEQLLLAHREMTNAGYVHLGLDHFALPRDALTRAHEERSMGRNFMGYIPRRGVKLLAFGVSGIGDLMDGYFQNTKKLSSYFDRLNAEDLPIERGRILDRDDILRRSVIQDVLCNLQVDFAAFKREAGVPFELYFAEEMADVREQARDGLVHVTDELLVVSSLGQLLLRNVAMSFDGYLRRGRGGAGRFSRTV